MHRKQRCIFRLMQNVIKKWMSKIFFVATQISFLVLINLLLFFSLSLKLMVVDEVI
jgi:hypothetical protein